MNYRISAARTVTVTLRRKSIYYFPQLCHQFLGDIGKMIDSLSRPCLAHERASAQPPQWKVSQCLWSKWPMSTVFALCNMLVNLTSYRLLYTTGFCFNTVTKVNTGLSFRKLGDPSDETFSGFTLSIKPGEESVLCCMSKCSCIREALMWSSYLKKVLGVT